jgi:flagellar basal body-associated protein FliL
MAEEKTAETPAPSSSSNKNPLLMLLMIVNIAAMATVAFFQWKFMQIEASRPDLTQLLKEKDAESKRKPRL